MRPLFLWLSRNRTAEHIALNFGPARKMARRFVAGETRRDVLEVVRNLNERGMFTSLDFLGENVESREEAEEARDEYLELLDDLNRSGLSSHISIKLTQMGMDIDFDFCYENARAIAERARKYETFMRIDMESSDYTDRTLEIHRRLHEEFKEYVGVVIQAYLRRSEEDMVKLIEMGANVRLCKGAYKEPADIAFPKKRDVDLNFIKLMDMAFSEEALRRGFYLAVATHDPKLIEWARKETEKRGIGKDRFEFQMLYGIRRDLQEELVRDGYKMRVYVPYGNSWYPYFMRRLAERPANVFFVLKNLVRG